MQIIAQLETQLRREKEVLAAMMRHLHPDNANNAAGGGNNEPPPSPPLSKRFKSDPSPDIRMSIPELFKSQGNTSHQYTNPLTHLMNLNPSTPSLSPLAALSTTSPLLPPTPTSIRSSLSEKSAYSPSGGLLTDSPLHHQQHRRRVAHHDRGNPNLDPEEDLAKNREFYRVQDVRPPYTYAALIRAVSNHLFIIIHFSFFHYFSISFYPLSSLFIPISHSISYYNEIAIHCFAVHHCLKFGLRGRNYSFQ